MGIGLRFWKLWMPAGVFSAMADFMGWLVAYETTRYAFGSGSSGLRGEEHLLLRQSGWRRPRSPCPPSSKSLYQDVLVGMLSNRELGPAGPGCGVLSRPGAASKSCRLINGIAPSRPHQSVCQRRSGQLGVLYNLIHAHLAAFISPIRPSWQLESCFIFSCCIPWAMLVASSCGGLLTQSSFWKAKVA